jgi:hypothetical protein
MKKTIIATLVGAVIIFAWQSVSWVLLKHHDAAYKQVANQDSVMNSLNSFFTEEGQYVIPRADANASQKDQAEFTEKNIGKPWALVTYHKAYKGDMNAALVRGFLISLVCVGLFVWLIGNNPGNMLTIIMKSIGVGLFAFLFVWYNGHNWFDTPWSVLHGELLDLVVGWGLCGIWLGWWLNKQKT